MIDIEPVRIATRRENAIPECGGDVSPRSGPVYARGETVGQLSPAKKLECAPSLVAANWYSPPIQSVSSAVRE